MEKIRLSNGVEMPMLGFGTYQLTDPEECRQSIITAVRAGYRLIDTAQAYGNEEAVGAGIRSVIEAGLVKREELFVTTKVWFRSFEEEDCRRTVEESLRKLGLDYVDMELLHWPFGNVYAAWRVLEEYYEAGKIRAIGVSNMEADRIIDLITFNRVKPHLNQIEVNLYCQRKEERRWLDKYGIAYQAYSPLGQGLANEMFAEEAVRDIAAARGKTPAQVLLRYLTQLNTAVIPKSSHEERIRENFALFDFTLTEAELDALSVLDRARPLIGRPEDPEKVEIAMGW